jgi:hypothetical protein
MKDTSSLIFPSIDPYHFYILYNIKRNIKD